MVLYDSKCVLWNEEIKDEDITVSIRGKKCCGNHMVRKTNNRYINQKVRQLPEGRLVAEEVAIQDYVIR